MSEELEADEIAQLRAMAINDFLHSMSVGNNANVAFERAVDGDATSGLQMPSNICVQVLP